MLLSNAGHPHILLTHPDVSALVLIESRQVVGLNGCLVTFAGVVRGLTCLPIMNEQAVAVCGNPYKPITVGQHVDAGLAVQSPQSLAVDVADMGKPFCVGINMPQFSLLCGDDCVASVVAFHGTITGQSVWKWQGFELLFKHILKIS